MGRATMGCAARCAATGRLLRMLWWPKHGPLARAVPGTAHGSLGRVMLGSGQILHAVC
jgi:hypothetical protein